MVLFGSSPAERAKQTDIPERTLRRKADRFDAEGMASLFEPKRPAAPRAVPPAMRRAIVASGLSCSQDLTAFLIILFAAVRQHGAPKALVSDSGGIFQAKEARRICRALKIKKEQIDRGQAWQSYIETTFNIQRQIADWHFAYATTWQELREAHDRWVAEYNYQVHWAHREREDGRRSPAEVLSWVTGTVYSDEELRRLFTLRFARRLDPQGYVRFRH